MITMGHEAVGTRSYLKSIQEWNSTFFTSSSTFLAEIITISAILTNIRNQGIRGVGK